MIKRKSRSPKSPNSGNRNHNIGSIDEVNVGYITAGNHDTSDIGPLNLELSVCDSHPKRGASRNNRISKNKNRTMNNQTPKKFPRNTSDSFSRERSQISPRQFSNRFSATNKKSPKGYIGGK